MADMTTAQAVPPCHALGHPREPMFEGDYSFNTGEFKQIGVVDYVFFVGALLISTLIGFYQAWNHRQGLGLDIYFLAGRSMTAVPVSMSIMASAMSAISIMGISEDVYLHSTMYFWDTVSIIIACCLTAEVLMPTFYELNVPTTFEYLQLRFNKRVSTVAAVFFVSQMMVYMTFALYAPSVALNTVTGFSLWGSIISVGVCSTLYVTIGGIKAVIWTDAFQAVVIFVGLVVVLIQATVAVGGLPDVWESLLRSNRVQFADFRLNVAYDHTVWGYLFGSTLMWLNLYGLNQNNIQRCMACRTLRTAKRACWLSSVWSILLNTLCCLMGMFMAAFYENCDPKMAGFITDRKQLAVTFVVDIFGDLPLTGFYLSVLFSGALSTFSTCLNGLSYVLLETFIKPYTKTKLNESAMRRIMQFFCAIAGLVSIVMTRLVSSSDNILQTANMLIGGIGTPIFGVFCLGLLFPHATSEGVIACAVSCLVVSVSLFIKGQDRPNIELAETCVSNCNVSVLSDQTRENLLKPYVEERPLDLNDYSFLTTLSSWYNFPISLTAGILCGFFVSFIFGFKDPKSIDPRLIVPVLDVLFPFYYLPEKFRKLFRFGVDHSNKWEKGETEKYVPVQTVRPTNEITPGSISVNVREGGTGAQRTSKAASSFPGDGSQVTTSDHRDDTTTVAQSIV